MYSPCLQVRIRVILSSSKIFIMISWIARSMISRIARPMISWITHPVISQIARPVVSQIACPMEVGQLVQ